MPVCNGCIFGQVRFEEMTDFDVVIIGAGIAGASLAAELGAGTRTLLLEAEAQPGYHSTGRSAAFWTESYGGPHVQPLTTASGSFLSNPPLEYSTRPFMEKRGALYIGTANDAEAAERLCRDFAGSGVNILPGTISQMRSYIPDLRSEWTMCLWEAECCHIDVAALHGAYLSQFKRNGGQLLCNARLTKAQYAEGHWSVETRSGTYTARYIVNAAGAWADEVAKMAGVAPIGIKPYRRTIAQIITVPPAPSNSPLVLALDGSFYFKSDSAGRIWLSPHDETLTMPCDTAPEEIDVAMAIDRFQSVADWSVKRVEHKWAGLRSFAPDRLPVIGFDTDNPAFFWLAGQGGFGIQTAPAVAGLSAKLLLGNANVEARINPAFYDPKRFR
jgi:D-arginine dehydrogenase